MYCQFINYSKHFKSVNNRVVSDTDFAGYLAWPALPNTGYPAGYMAKNKFSFNVKNY